MDAARGTRRVQRIWRLALVCGILAATTAVIAAEEPSTPKAAPPISQRIKQGEFSAAVMMWCGVLCVGILLIAMVIVWGRGLRRMVRKPVKPMTEVDPLWYLKQKKPIANSSPPTNSENESPPTP